jgi:hypothetical protein
MLLSQRREMDVQPEVASARLYFCSQTWFFCVKCMALARKLVFPNFWRKMRIRKEVPHCGRS